VRRGDGVKHVNVLHDINRGEKEDNKKQGKEPVEKPWKVWG
jgi:hypothetical protein